MTIGDITKTARRKLCDELYSNTWLTMVAALLILFAVSTASTVLSLAVLFVVFLGPINYTEQKIFFNLVHYGTLPTDYKNYTTGFREEITTNVIICFMTSLYTFLWSLLLIVPGVIKAYGYSMAYYLKMNHTEYTWRAAVDESIRLTDGKKLKLFLLDLSFIGWYLLGLLCFGIGVLWVAALHKTARMVLFEEIVEFNKEENESANSDNVGGGSDYSAAIAENDREVGGDFTDDDLSLIEKIQKTKNIDGVDDDEKDGATLVENADDEVEID